MNGDGLAGINVRPQDSPWDKYTSLVLDNAIIESDGTTANLVAGASSYAGFHTVQVNGQVICTGDTVMNTTASSGKENLGAGGSNNFIVTGGSYKIYYNPSYYNSYGSSVPVNGADHGNESLSYFQLSDPSRTSVSTIDKNGTTYTYPVANASADGQKYIWVPGEDVTFKLNQTGARFADKTTSDKKIKAIRGGTFADAVKANGVSTTVDNPTCTGLKFAGWYTDADCTDGNEFDPAAVTVTAPLTVYAKWIPSDTFGISYHSNLSYGSSDYDVEGEGADRSMTVMSYEDVIAANAAFKPKNGYTIQRMEYQGRRNRHFLCVGRYDHFFGK